MSSPEPSRSSLYRAVWRWHFIAGVVTAPLAIFLALTGALYLWRPQYEAWRYGSLLKVEAPLHAKAVSADQQFAAARATHPGAAFVSFSPAASAGASSETVLVVGQGDPVSVFVNPYTGQVLGERRDSDRLMMVLHDLHGTLLSGHTGQYVVELAATWMFVLILTGFYLWWPRPRFSVWGFLLPRLRSGRKLFWRDLHAVTAVWSSLGMAFLLTTGMLWTQAGGGWYRTVSSALGQGTPKASLASEHQSVRLGWSPPLKGEAARAVDSARSLPPSQPSAMHHRRGRSPSVTSLADGSITLLRVEEIAEANGMPKPYSILFPNGPTGVYSAVSDRDHPFDRTYLHLDQYSGKVLADVRYRDFGALGKFGMWAIIAHEGQLFGLANQILGTLAAFAVIAIAGSGLMLWRLRRPELQERAEKESLPLGMKVGLGVLSLVLPLLLPSLLAIVAADFGFRKLRPSVAAA